MKSDDSFSTLDLIQIPIFVLRTDGDSIKFIYLNEYYSRVVGINIADIMNKTTHEFLPVRTAQTMERNYKKCVFSKERFSYEEVLNLDGEERWWRTTLSPIKDRFDNVVQIIGSCEDITDNKNHEINLNKSITDLRDCNSDILTFSSMAAHDLRPSIGNIKTLIDFILIDFQDLGNHKIKSLRMVRDIAEKANIYIDNILTNSQNLNVEKPTYRRINVDHMLGDIVALLDPHSRSTIIYESVEIDCEAIPLQIILHNLVDNALKNASSKVKVKFTNSIERKNQVVISVSDDGLGFKGGASSFNAWLNQRKDPFVKGNTGFGLRAIQKIVETRGGLFWLGDSEFNGGATFCISIPGSTIDAKES